MKRLKTKNYAFRVSEKDLEMIKQRAHKAKLTVTDYITKCSLNKNIIVVEGLPEVVTELKRIGNNLNQLTRLANMKELSVVDLTETEDKLNEIYFVLTEILKEANNNGNI